MNATPTAIDNVAAILGLIILVVSLLTLLGMGALMAIGAMFSHRPLVTSWPNEQEQSFAPYERRGASANSQAWVASLVGAVLVTGLAAGIYFGVTPETKDMTKGMNMSNLTKKPTPPPPPRAAAPAPATPAPAEAAPAPAAAPAPTK